MLVDFIFMLILSFLFLYSYRTTQNQFAATASAIRQIWSGGCRLSCLQSEFSGFSGLNSPQSSPGHRRSMASQNSTPGNSRECACESCPCALIENFLRSCRPTSNICSQITQCTVNCVYYFIQMFVDAYDYFTRILECISSCQRQPQLDEETDKCDSNENFSFSQDDKTKIAEKLEQIAEREKMGGSSSKKLSKEKINIKEIQKNINLNKFDDHPNKQVSKEVTKPQTAENTKGRKIAEHSSNETNLRTSGSCAPLCRVLSDNIIPTEAESKLREKSDESAAKKGLCSKCIEKGRTCVKECPRSKGDKSK